MVWSILFRDSVSIGKKTEEFVSGHTWNEGQSKVITDDVNFRFNCRLSRVCRWRRIARGWLGWWCHRCTVATRKQCPYSPRCNRLSERSRQLARDCTSSWSSWLTCKVQQISQCCLHRGWKKTTSRLTWRAPVHWTCLGCKHPLGPLHLHSPSAGVVWTQSSQIWNEVMFKIT